MEDHLLPWTTGILEPAGGLIGWFVNGYRDVAAVVVNTVGLVVYVATLVGITASLWKTIG